MRNCFNFDVENKQRIYQKVLTGGNNFKNKKRILEKKFPTPDAVNAQPQSVCRGIKFFHVLSTFKNLAQIIDVADSLN